jgi:hypothetical protein
MAQRSDGVKRFITFLLHISANVKSKTLTDSLLLIDEPDMGLHPSGSKYLRDELIAISENNSVVFSTHSIFMIDRECISRHIMVEKTDETTEVKNADASNFVDEEVLFNALNYSVFEVLKKDNLLFEGWRDKKLFQTAMEKVPASHTERLKALRKKAKTLGLCHAEGVKDFRNLTPLLELAGRNCLILSDADKAAKEKQKEFNELHGYGSWYRYDEVSDAATAATGEDFLTAAAFSAGIEKLRLEFPELANAPAFTQSGRMNVIRAWLAGQGISGDALRGKQASLKEHLFSALNPSEIDISYFDYLVALNAVIGKEMPSD